MMSSQKNPLGPLFLCSDTAQVKNKFQDSNRRQSTFHLDVIILQYFPHNQYQPVKLYACQFLPQKACPHRPRSNPLISNISVAE